MKWAVISLLFLAFAPANGQDSPPAPGPTGIGSGVSAPHLIYKREPDYAGEARNARLEGTVTLSLVVDVDGIPKDIKVFKSLGLGLDEKAIEAVSAWQFAPGQKDGKPLPIPAKLEINFRLLDNVGRWHLTRALFKPHEGASLPTLTKTKFPRDSPSEESGSVVLTLDVNEKGRPVNLHVEKSSDARWEEDVIAAAREWRFTPGQKSGRAVLVPLTLEFSFAPKKPQ